VRISGALVAALTVASAVLGGCAPGPTGAAASTADGAAGPPVTTRWVPPPGTTWQWQLTTPVDTSVDAEVYDIDGVEAGADTVAALHRAGRKVVCYVNAGAAEDFRPDHAAFPDDVQGGPDGWNGERLLDIRRIDVLEPIMAARFDMCREKGFDGVEADLVDGYVQASGFPLTAADQLTYNRMLADLAHERGLSIGLKNDLDQVVELVDEFDFAVNEQCFRYEECDRLAPFVRAGKAVFTAEYELEPAEFCPAARAAGLSSMQKRLNLDAWRRPC
jgi:hypothetical protein